MKWQFSLMLLFCFLIALRANAFLPIVSSDTIKKYVVIESLSVNKMSFAIEDLHYIFNNEFSCNKILDYSEANNKKNKIENLILELDFLPNDSLIFFLPLDKETSCVKIYLNNHKSDTIKIKSWKIYNNCLGDSVTSSVWYYQYENGKMIDGDEGLIKSKYKKYLNKSDFPSRHKSCSIEINEHKYWVKLNPQFLKNYDVKFPESLSQNSKIRNSKFEQMEVHVYHGYKTKRDMEIAENLEQLMEKSPKKIFRYIKFASTQTIKERYLVGALVIE